MRKKIKKKLRTCSKCFTKKFVCHWEELDQLKILKSLNYFQRSLKYFKKFFNQTRIDDTKWVILK